MTTTHTSLTDNLIALSLACTFANGCSDTNKTPVQERAANTQMDPFYQAETLTTRVDFSNEQQQSWFFDKHISHQFIASVNSQKLALNFSAQGNISMFGLHSQSRSYLHN